MRILRSFRYAFNGIRIAITEERNVKIHILAALCVIIASILLKISLYEWVAVVFSIALVFAFEIINTAIENIADYISPEKNPAIKRIKDLSAAAVLISAIAAFITALIIFIPRIIGLF